jgi:hypothetical protein
MRRVAVFRKIPIFLIWALFSPWLSADTTTYINDWQIYSEKPDSAYIASYGLPPVYTTKATLAQLNSPEKEFLERPLSEFAHSIRLFIVDGVPRIRLNFNKVTTPEARTLTESLAKSGEFLVQFDVDGMKSAEMWFKLRNDKTGYFGVETAPDNHINVFNRLLTSMKGGRILRVSIPSLNGTSMVESAFSLYGLTWAYKLLPK